jgi:hypothetical protein
MSLQSVRDQIKTIIQQADPGSMVHDYERWTNQPDTLLALFKPSADTHLRAWIFKPTSIAEFHYTQQSNLAVYVFLVRFLYSEVDSEATEKTASQIIEAVRAAFRADLTLNTDRINTAIDEGPLQGLAGLQLDKLDLITLGGVMCHYGELRLAVQELVP